MPYVQRRSRHPTQLTARQLAHLTTIPKLPSSPFDTHPTSINSVTSPQPPPRRFDAPSSRTLIIEEVNGITRVIKEENLGRGAVKEKKEGDRVGGNEHVREGSNKVMPTDQQGRGRSDSIVRDITNDSTASLRRPGSKRSESQISFEMILPDSQFDQKVKEFYAENRLVHNDDRGEDYPEHEEWTFLNYEEEEILTETGGSITERLFCVTTRA